MSTFEREFLDRHGEPGVLPILEAWERINKVPHAHAVLTIEQRWDRFILITDRSNDNMLPPPAAALAVGTA